MVERQEDSIGPSPLIKGEEKHKCDLCVGVADLVDARLCATYTRPALHQTGVASDAANHRRRSYFKMDFKMFIREEVLTRARASWLDHPTWARDKRKRWSLALGRIRRLLMEVKEDDKRRILPIRTLEEKVECARLRVQQDTTVEAKESFEEAITNLRRREHEDAELCRRKCPPQMWMEDSGCEVAGPGKKFVYLGVSTSTPIDEKTIADEIVQKMLKKLKHWSNRNFLWGWNEEGNPKTSLIAWERIAQTKHNGGLGWTRFKEKSDALNVRLVGRILEGEDVEWIHLARSFILRTLRRGSYQRECRQWTTREGLLLFPLTKIAGSPTLTRILSS
ncbi:hypothetical protein R1sor_013083 [Riccia sorocarpa]|uniref:Uncharacterized protein n=1 Tax=Riccia sorocarpa TaxID=122646 RepID=A0ABD3H8C6_9MARC